MRCWVIGVKHMRGLSKAGGTPFDFRRVTLLGALRPTSGERFTLAGHGFEAVDVELADFAWSQFEGVEFPAELELRVEQVPGRRGLESIVMGIEGARPQAVSGGAK